MSSSPALQMLIDGGFRHLGCWVADGGTGGILRGFTTDVAPGVYAYVVAGKVCYVGSAQRGLAKRLRHYEIAKTLRTSARIRAEIRSCLTNGEVVDVYVLVPPPHDWNGLPVNLIAGIEEGLIRTLLPAWNRRSNRAG